MTRLEQRVRETWVASGGEGEPPPLIVTPEQYEDFKAAGFPEERMRIDRPLPMDDRPFLSDMGWLGLMVFLGIVLGLVYAWLISL
jgi:hypothetical protein